MFPGAGAVVYRNEAGEPLGWDYPSDDPYDSYSEDLDRSREDAWDVAEDEIFQRFEETAGPDDEFNPNDHSDAINERARAILAEWRERDVD